MDFIPLLTFLIFFIREPLLTFDKPFARKSESLSLFLSLLYTFALFFFKSTRGNLLVKDIFNVVSHVHTKYDRVYNRKMSIQNGIVI